MRFLRAVREDAALRDQLAEVASAGSLAAVAELARSHGFSCTAAELREAYAHDWAMRRVRYVLAPRVATTVSADSTVAVVKSALSST